MFTTNKIALVSVINDLASDNRVHKTCMTLIECGYQVTLIGRKLPNSPSLAPTSYVRKRMKLFFVSGPLFYLFFNLRLFLRLLLSRAHLLYSNDLDTLLPNYLVSRLKKIPLIYDSHELFCEVPELVTSPLKRQIWLTLERSIVPKLKHCITVNDSIAEIFQKKYGTVFHSVRNIPEKSTENIKTSRAQLGLPTEKKILILQGAGLNVDRGAEELVDAMRYLQDCVLLIIGGGDVWENLKEKIKVGLKDKVILIERIPKEKLLLYTQNSDLGISIDKNTNLNYYYSLPNKVFDYIHAGIPVLASRLPEIEKIITQYNVGDFISDHIPENIAKKIMELLYSPKLIEYKNNTKVAAGILTWKHEQEKLRAVILSV